MIAEHERRVMDLIDAVSVGTRYVCQSANGETVGRTVEIARLVDDLLDSPIGFAKLDGTEARA